MWPTTSLLRLLVPFPPSPERLARSFYQVGIFDFSLILTRDGPPDGIPAARLFFRRIGIGNAERIRHLQIGVTLEQLEDFDRAILPFVCEIPPKRSPFGIPLVLQQPQLFGNGSTYEYHFKIGVNGLAALQLTLITVIIVQNSCQSNYSSCVHLIRVLTSLVVKINQRLLEMRERLPKVDFTSRLPNELLYLILSFGTNSNVIWRARDYWWPWPTRPPKEKYTELLDVNTKMRSLIRRNWNTYSSFEIPRLAALRPFVKSHGDFRISRFFFIGPSSILNITLGPLSMCQRARHMFRRGTPSIFDVLERIIQARGLQQTASNIDVLPRSHWQVDPAVLVQNHLYHQFDYFELVIVVTGLLGRELNFILCFSTPRGPQLLICQMIFATFRNCIGTFKHRMKRRARRENMHSQALALVEW